MILANDCEAMSRGSVRHGLIVAVLTNRLPRLIDGDLGVEARAGRLRAVSTQGLR